MHALVSPAGTDLTRRSRAERATVDVADARLEDEAGLVAPHLARARQIIEATGYHRRDGELVELTRKLADASGPGAA